MKEVWIIIAGSIERVDGYIMLVIGFKLVTAAELGGVSAIGFSYLIPVPYTFPIYSLFSNNVSRSIKKRKYELL